MARKKRHNQYNHVKFIGVRITGREWLELDAIADYTSMNMSDVIRHLIHAEYVRTLEEMARDDVKQKIINV